MMRSYKIWNFSLNIRIKKRFGLTRRRPCTGEMRDLGAGVRIILNQTLKEQDVKMSQLINT
jgi:hypothetical protein